MDWTVQIIRIDLITSVFSVLHVTAKPKIMGAAETLKLKLQQSVTNKYNGRVSEADISECSIDRAIK